MPLDPQFDKLDGLGLAESIARGALSAVDLVRDRIARLTLADQRLGLLASTRFEEAVDEARLIEAGRGQPGPFAGVPFLVSDFGISIRGARVTRGSRMLADFVCSHDSPLYRRYRQAGLVTLGIARTAEFGLSMVTEPALHGATRNPHDLSRSAGGGCGGAAAAVAAGLVPVAHGSDLCAGMRLPAALCGVFALKPTRDRLPSGPRRTEPWAGLESCHVFSRTVRDSAAMLDLTAGRESGAYHAAPPMAASWRRAAETPPPRLRIAATWRTPTGSRIDRDSARALDRVVAALAEAGHEIFEAEPRYAPEALMDSMRCVIGATLAHEIDSLARARGVTPSPDLVEPLTWLWYEEGAQWNATDYIAAHETMQRVGPRFASFFDEYDLALAPSWDGPAPVIGALDQIATDLDSYWALVHASAPYLMCYSVTGHPAAVLPVPPEPAAPGTTTPARPALPASVQLGAPFGREDLLFMVAGQLEQMLQGRSPARGELTR